MAAKAEIVEEGLPRRQGTIIQENWPLLVIIGVFIALVFLYTISVPPFEGPDEAQHFAYIEWLARGKGFPPQGDAAWETPIEQEAGQPPLYYLLASIPARIVGVDDPEAVYYENPYFVAPLPREVPDNDNRAIRHPRDGLPLAGGWLALYLSRTVTLLFGILLVISVYGLARQVMPRTRPIAITAALLAAITPQIVYITSVVSNDIPAAALSTLALWQLALIIRKGPRARYALGLGIAYGCAVLTKISTVSLALPIAAAYGWLWLSGLYPRRKLVESAALAAVAALAIAGWWSARTWILYGSPLGLQTHDATPWAVTNPEDMAKPLARWKEVGRSYWIALGWGIIRPHGWVYNVLLFLSIVGLAGLGLAAWRWWRRPGPRDTKTPALLVILVLALVTLGMVLEYWQQRVVAPYGRLMFPAIGTVTILLATGWWVIRPRLPVIPLVFVGACAALAPFLLIRPAYTPPPLLTEAEIEQLSPRQGWVYTTLEGQPLAELLKVEPLKRSAGAGTVLPVRVCWLVLNEVHKNYTVLLQVIGPENRLVTHRRSYPGQGMYPTEYWRAGDAFCDTMHVHVWLDLAETLVYRVEVAFLDEESNRRLPGYDSYGNELTNNFVDYVRLVTLDPQTAPVEELSEDPAGIHLLEYDVTNRWSPGQTYPFTLTWSAATEMDRDYQVFVHLRDPSSGEPIAQADGPPLAGWYPTSWWPAGEVIVDNRTFPLPAEVPPGTYDLVVGFYDLASGQRFGREFSLAAIEVTP